MASGISNAAEKALYMLRALPRISHNNIKNFGKPKKATRGRGQYGGDKHGAGNKGSGQRQNYMRLGYETGNTPFYLRFPYEPYYKGHHLRKQYPPISLLQLQTLIDTNRIDISKPIDLASICNTGVFTISPEEKHYGFNLTDEGADAFSAKINIEVQWASEGTIAAIERNGGIITTAFYDIHSLFILRDPLKFFKRGEPIPRRMMPSEDVLQYYSDPAHRGYLADPEAVAAQRLVLSQKYGYPYVPPPAEDQAPRKDPRQIFYGLAPGWVVSLTDKHIVKPKDPRLQHFYQS